MAGSDQTPRRAGALPGTWGGRGVATTRTRGSLQDQGVQGSLWGPSYLSFSWQLSHSAQGERPLTQKPRCPPRAHGVQPDSEPESEPTASVSHT